MTANTGIGFLKQNFVYVRRKQNGSAFGNEVEKSSKIGGSSRGQDVLRGLNPQEEIKYLPAIIGVQPNDTQWQRTAREYWANISSPVPDGEGKKLNISMWYANEDAANADKANVKGEPENIGDYILWRYCLVYGRVANSADLAEASPKIKFYLFSEQEERSRKKVTIEAKLKATQKMLEVRNDTSKCKNLFIVFSKDDKTIPPLSSIPVDEYDILLDRLCTENPEKFIAIADDPNLQAKSFIERCVIKGLLKRIPNTDALMTEDSNVIGNTLEEVVGLLSSEKGITLMETLKAKLKAA